MDGLCTCRSPLRAQTQETRRRSRQSVSASTPAGVRVACSQRYRQPRMPFHTQPPRLDTTCLSEEQAGTDTVRSQADIGPKVQNNTGRASNRLVCSYRFVRTFIYCRSLSIRARVATSLLQFPFLKSIPTFAICVFLECFAPRLDVPRSRLRF